MTTTLQELKDRLMATDEEFSRPAREHSSFEGQLAQLSNRPYLTDTEKIEEIKLKKLKLSLKDQMEKILQRHK